MLSIENHVGRLVESRIIPPLFDAEIDRYDIRRGKTIRTVLESHPRFINCSDLRQLKILSSLHSKRFIEILRGNNPSLERAAFLISTKTLNLQVMRVIRESGNPNRRHFEDVDEMCAWLGEVLTPEEQERLQQFLNEARLTQ